MNSGLDVIRREIEFLDGLLKQVPETRWRLKGNDLVVFNDQVAFLYRQRKELLTSYDILAWALMGRSERPVRKTAARPRPAGRRALERYRAERFAV